jgi:hypothetical protein
MEKLRNILYSDKNIQMIQSICLKKIKFNVPKMEFDKIMEIFEETFNTVMNTVFIEEIKNNGDISIKNAIIKINNIVIKEAYTYILNLDMEMSTKIEDIPEEKTEYIEELRREVSQKEDIKEATIPIPNFEEDLYEISSKDMTKDGDVYTSELYIPNIKNLELLQIRVDKSDYMITEYCNKFTVNNIQIEIPTGNYSEVELVECIQNLLDLNVNSKDDYIFKVCITFQRNRECFVLSYKETLLNESSNMSSVNVDFSGKTSIAYLIGFEKRIYSFNIGDSSSGMKHHLAFPILALFNIDFTSEVKAQAVVPLNVEYNGTKFYDLEYKKLYTSPNEPLFNISNIKITVQNERNEPYNTRGRDFYIRFKTNCLHI